MAYRPDASVISDPVLEGVTRTSEELDAAAKAAIADEVRNDPSGIGYKGAGGAPMRPRDVANLLNRSGRGTALTGCLIDALDVREALDAPAAPESAEAPVAAPGAAVAEAPVAPPSGAGEGEVDAS